MNSQWALSSNINHQTQLRLYWQQSKRGMWSGRDGNSAWWPILNINLQILNTEMKDQTLPRSSSRLSYKLSVLCHQGSLSGCTDTQIETFNHQPPNNQLLTSHTKETFKLNIIKILNNKWKLYYKLLRFKLWEKLIYFSEKYNSFKLETIETIILFQIRYSWKIAKPAV